MTMKRAVHETVQNIVDRLPEELVEAWEEKSAVMEYDAGLSRQHAEALALLNLLDDDPDVISELRAAQIDVGDAPRFFVGSSKELLDEVAGRLGGEIAARRSVAWVLDEEFGGLCECVAAA
jgi:hypothetical protein